MIATITDFGCQSPLGETNADNRLLATDYWLLILCHGLLIGRQRDSVQVVGQIVP
jgi:hypothetical protein